MLEEDVQPPSPLDSPLSSSCHLLLSAPSLANYYTIAMVPQSPSDECNDYITSFTNPNYTLNHDDIINCNLSTSANISPTYDNALACRPSVSESTNFGDMTTVVAAKCCTATSPRDEWQVHMPMSIDTSLEGCLFESDDGSVAEVKVKGDTCVMTQSDFSVDDGHGGVARHVANEVKGNKEEGVVRSDCSLNDKDGGVVEQRAKLLARIQSFEYFDGMSVDVIGCRYLGCISVPQASGVTMFNSAMEQLFSESQCNSVQPRPVLVTVSPSTITIAEPDQCDVVLAECRVRFLSFVAIALSDVRLCGFVVHTTQDQFVAHVLYAEPSAGYLCRTIEAACKLRYEKCVEAHKWHRAELVKRRSLEGATKTRRQAIVSRVQCVAHNVLGRFLRKPSSLALS